MIIIQPLYVPYRLRSSVSGRFCRTRTQGFSSISYSDIYTVGR